MSEGQRRAILQAFSAEGFKINAGFLCFYYSQQLQPMSVYLSVRP